MTTTRDKNEAFARLFRMMDSSFEGEALNAFRQARRMLQKERATFAAILDHTQQLNETNAALDDQNRDLHLENEKYRSRDDRGGLKRAARARFGQLATWLPLTAAATLEPDQSGEGTPDPSPRSRPSWKNIPRDLRTLLSIFAIVAATTVACHMVAFDHEADGPVSTSAAHGWLAKLPANFSVDHPPWCVSCRNHQNQPVAQRQNGQTSSGSAKLPANFSIDHPPWCLACRHQQTQPDAERQRQYGRMF
jgi:hypothetical protein